MVNVSTSRLVWFVVSAGTLLGACNAVLGITEATVDPSFGTGGATGSTSSTAGTGGGPATPCAAYCQTINKNCTGIYNEYNNEQVCEAACAFLEPGSAGDMANDTLACRAYHAGLAAGAPEIHCRQAGLLGVGTCNADPCRPFCEIGFDLCSPATQFPFPNGQADAGGTVADCRTECANFAYVEVDGGYVGDLAYTFGDTLNCRLYHLESAFDTSIPHPITTHCPHLATDSATCN